MNRIICIYLFLTCLNLYCSGQENRNPHYFRVTVIVTDLPEYTDIVHGIYTGMTSHFIVDSFSIHGLTKYELIIKIDSTRADKLNIETDSIYSKLDSLQRPEDLNRRYVYDSAGNKIPVSAFSSVELRKIPDTFELNGKRGVQLIYIISSEEKKKSVIKSQVSTILNDVRRSDFPYSTHYVSVKKYRE
jgi:hypothetical protein